MSHESMQTLSQCIIFVGLLLAAAGSFGSYYFGKKANALKEVELAKQQNEAVQLQRSILQGQEEIKAKLQATELSIYDRLKKDYPLGYALIYTDGQRIIFEDKHVDEITVNWSQSEIVAFTDERVEIRIPDWIDEGTQASIGHSYMSLIRKTGRKVGAIGTPTVRMLGEVVESNPQYVIVVIGFVRRTN